MKAPDTHAERWMLRPAEEIIERLLSLSSRTIGLPLSVPTARRQRDRYYTQARRLHVRRLMRGRA